MTIHAASLLLCMSLLSQANDDQLSWALKEIYSNNEYRVYEAAPIIAAEDKQAVSTLLDALNSSSVHVQPLIIDGLASLGPRAKPAISELHKLLNSKDVYIRMATIKALGKIDPAKFSPEFAALYELEKDHRVRETLLTAMSPGSPEVKAALKKALNEADPVSEALDLAKRYGPEARDCLARIIEIVRSNPTKNDPRGSAIEAIWVIDPDSPATVEATEKMADNESPYLQSTALRALARSQHPRAVEIIKQHLSDDDADVRESAVWSLGFKKEQSAAAELDQMLRAEDALHVRCEIVWALWAIERNANETAERNLEIMREAKRIDQKDVGSIQIDQILQDTAQLAGELGPAAGNSVRLLRVLLGDSSPQIRNETIRSLQAIGEPSFQAIPNLKYVARFDNHPRIRQKAAACIKVLEKHQAALASPKKD